MLHHVGFEVAAELMTAEGEFWLAAGFRQVPAATALGPGFGWYEKDGTQIHLMETDDPAPPARRGHVAIVAPDFEGTLSRLRAAGFEAEEARILWRARRAKAITPSGHRVELMEFPPEPAGGPA